MIGIYFIKNKINSKIYVGSSIRIEKRWIDHRATLKANTHANDYLQKSWNKYGSNNFEFGILEICSKDQIEEKEIYWITKLQTMNKSKGYNLLFQCSRPIMTEEVRKKKSKATKKLWKDKKFREKVIQTMIQNRRTNPTESRKQSFKKSGLSRRDNRKVGQFDMNGNLERVFENRREAFLFYNRSRTIYRVLEGKERYKTFHGKSFKYIN